MNRTLLVCIVVLFSAHSAWTSIPRACSNSSVDGFPFCNPKLDLNTRIQDLISRIHDDEKPPLLTARMSPLGNISRIGLPEYDWGANCIHGVQSHCGTSCPTSFPNPNALGATENNRFNMNNVYTMASIIGLELRSLWLQGVGENSASHLPHLGLDCWSPNININRDPRWGRNQEVPGEDPFLSGQYGVAYTKGLQEGKLDNRYLQAVVTLKHWDAYSFEELRGTNITRYNFDAIVSPYDLANTYFPAFRASVIQGKAKGVMCAYNSVNGVPCCASQFFNTTLRGSWGFDGYVTSDSDSIDNIVHEHKYVSSHPAAAAVAIKAGTDINSGTVYRDYLITAKTQGLVTDSDINTALYHSLKLRFQLGLFDPIDDQPYWHVSPAVVNTPQTQALNLQMTQEGMVLLKNVKNTLPFPKGKRIAVVGPHGDNSQVMVGNYLGQICPAGGFSCVVSPFAAIQAANKGGQTVYSKGCQVVEMDTSQIASAVATAKSADLVVLILGLNLTVEDEMNDRINISLPGVQNQLAQTIILLGKPTVVVLFNGGAVAIEWLHDNADAIIEAFYPGFQGGAALASVLFGDYNPGGKMPYTTYKADYVNQVDVMNMDMTKAPGRTYKYFSGDVLWPFGYGLSYTKFNITITNLNDLRRPIKNSAVDQLVCKIQVVNIGQVAGDEVVQLYFTPPPEVDRLLKKQLWAFERVHVGYRNSTVVSIPVDYTNLIVGDKNGNLVSYPGVYVIEVTNGVEISWKFNVTLTGTTRIIEQTAA